MEEITINIDKIKINDDWKEFVRGILKRTCNYP